MARRRLRELILDGTYPAGTRLTELEVAAALGMSRTPVREAIRALAADGLGGRCPVSDSLVTG